MTATATATATTATATTTATTTTTTGGIPIGETPCFDLSGAPSCEGSGDLGMMVPVSSLGSDLVFEAVGGAAVAARSTTTDVDEWFVMTYYAGPEPRRWRVVPPNSSNAVVRAVWAESGVEPYALVCERAEECAVYGVDPDQEESDALMQPIAGLDLLPEVELDGIVSSSADGLELCVFGDGLYCLQGDRWEVAVEGRRIEDVVASRGVAVGEAGRIWRQPRDADGRRLSGPWLELDTGSRETLVGVRVGWSDEIIAVGSEGFFYVLSTSGEVTSCQGTSPLALALHHYGPAVTSEGRLYTGWRGNGTWCEETAGPLSNLLGVSNQYCGISPNVILLTPDALYAPLGLECAVD